MNKLATKYLPANAMHMRSRRANNLQIYEKLANNKNKFMDAVKIFFKWLGIIITVVLMLATVILSLTIYKMLFSGNLATVLISAVFIAYVLFTSYFSSLLLLWISFWILPRWLSGTLAVFSLVVLISILGLIAAAYNAGPSGIAFVLPHFLYLISIYRMFRRIF